MILFAVVWEQAPQTIVQETGAPFDGENLEAATRECESTFGVHPEWLLVELTAALDAQYRALRVAS